MCGLDGRIVIRQLARTVTYRDGARLVDGEHPVIAELAGDLDDALRMTPDCPHPLRLDIAAHADALRAYWRAAEAA